MRSLPKVVVIGFNKCATRSIGQLFERAGHPTLHNKHRAKFRRSLSVGRLMRDNLAAGRRVFHGVEQYTLYCDLIWVGETETYDGNSAFREIDVQYPGTRFILNTRDRDAWIASRLRHGHGTFAARCQRVLGLQNLEALAARWRADWDHQHREVASYFAGRPDVLTVFDIDHDHPSKLVEAFSDYGLRVEDWGDTGRSRDVRLSPMKRAIKKWWARTRPRSSL